MKKIFFAAALLAAVCSCSQKPAEPAQAFIQPLPSGFNLDSLTDATVPAEFTVDNFNWMGGNLTMTVYSEDLYDAVALHQMKTGDTLVYNNDTLIVNQIEDKDGFLTINKGIEEGGAWIQAAEGGTYRACEFDDHSLYSKVGQVQIPLSDDFTIIDCKDDPNEPSDTIRTDQKLYLENLKDSKRDFNYLQTRVLIEHGVITNITRIWIP